MRCTNVIDNKRHNGIETSQNNYRLITSIIG